jgi:hypothetical protein
VPTPTIVIVLPTIVATLVLLLVYVNAPVLLLVGAVIVTGEAPTTCAGILKFESVGAFADFQNIHYRNKQC